MSCASRLPPWVVCLVFWTVLGAGAAHGQPAFDLAVRALAVTDSANPTFYVGTDRGMFRGDGSLDKLAAVHLLPVGERQSAVEQIFTHNNAVYARTSMPSEIWRSGDAGATWTLMSAGLPEFERMDELFLLPGNPAGLMVYLRDGLDGWIYRWDGGAAKWTLQSTLPIGPDEFGVNVNNPDIMLTNTGRRIWRSLNGGQDWTSISLTPFPSNQVNGATFVVPDPLNSNNVLLGGGGGSIRAGNGVYLSVDQGATWKLTLDTVANTLIYGADWPYFFHLASSAISGMNVSRSRGLTWEATTVSPGARTTSAAIDPRNDQIVYLGTRLSPEGSLFRSADSAKTWTPIRATVRPTLAGPTQPIVSEVPFGLGPRRATVPIGAIESSSWNVDFTVDAPSVPWLQLESDDDSITLTMDPAGLALGEHRTQVTVRSGVTVNPSFTFSAILRVVEAPSGDLPVIQTFAGTGDSEVSGDGGPALDAGLGFPGAIAVGPDGSVYLANASDNFIRKIDPDGVIQRFAGAGERGFAGDGGPALQALLAFPDDLAVAPDGVVYVADNFNNRVRRIDVQGLISTFAGNGEFLGRPPAVGGDASQVVMEPDALAVDAQGNVYIQDGRTLFVVAPDRSYRTLTDSMPSTSRALAVDPSGDVYASPIVGERVVVVRPNGDVEPFAGAGPAGFTGDGGPAVQATFDRPDGLAVGGGRVFIADRNNHVVRAVDANGVVRTFAGTGGGGFSGDGGPAIFAELQRPNQVVYDDGRLFILDRSNRRIRVVEATSGGGPQLSSQGVVNAAGFQFNEVSPGENISIFGDRLAESTAIAQSTPLPAELGGSRVTLTDSAGVTRPCLFFFAAVLQINCNVDDQTALGAATLTVETAGGGRGSIAIVVVSVAPGLFSANATGAGVAAAVGVRIAPGGAQSVVDIFDAATVPRVATPINLGPEGEQVVLLLFGTGIRNFQSSVDVTIGGQPAQVVGVAQQSEFVGLDQINVIIPRSLIGAGEVEIRVTVDGRIANVVTVRIQ